MNSFPFAIAGSVLLVLAGCSQSGVDNAIDNEVDATDNAVDAVANAADNGVDAAIDGKPAADGNEVGANVGGDKPIANDAAPVEGEITEKPSN